MTRALAVALVVTVSRVAGAAPTPSPDDAILAPEASPVPAPSVEMPDLTDAELAKLAEQDAKGETIILTGGSPRAVAEDFLILPDGLDLGGRLRLITAKAGLGVGELRITDLALFEASASWGLGHNLELDGSIAVLAKQPTATDEPVFQGGGLELRRGLGHQLAVALAGSAVPLLGMDGVALRPSAFVTHKHRLTELVAFAFAAGAGATFLRPDHADTRPVVLEGAGHASIEFRLDRIWGVWLGAGYALPVAHRGRDPMSGAALDPQPRLDLQLGTALRLADRWDLTLELTIVDRGDRDRPATQLPMLDGGFDQLQLAVGLTRRIELKSHRRAGVGDPMIRL